MIMEKAAVSDLNRIMEIIEQARAYLKSAGINQWQDGYPNRKSILTDIENGWGNVIKAGGEVCAYAAVIFGTEPTYKEIYNGNWLTESEKYAVIHRIAVAFNKKGNGIAGKIIGETADECKRMNIKSIRADTHRDNISMQRTLIKNGFVYCGIIYLSDGAERLAYELCINKLI